MQSTSVDSNTSRPRGRPRKQRSQRQIWLEAILPGRYNGYDLIRRYKLLDESLTDSEFHARVIDALTKYKERAPINTRKDFRKGNDG